MEKKKANKRFKRGLVGVVMTLLGKGIRYAYKVDERVKAEIDSLGDNCTIKMTVAPVGPSLLFGKADGKIFSKRCDYDTPADIVMSFKGVEGALLMFTGRMGLGEGYAQHRFTIKGDLYKVMAITRIMSYVESEMFPKFITKKIMNPVPKRAVNMLRFYLGMLFI